MPIKLSVTQANALAQKTAREINEKNGYLHENFKKTPEARALADKFRKSNPLYKKVLNARKLVEELNTIDEEIRLHRLSQGKTYRSSDAFFGVTDPKSILASLENSYLDSVNPHPTRNNELATRVYERLVIATIDSVQDIDKVIESLKEEFSKA